MTNAELIAKGALILDGVEKIRARRREADVLLAELERQGWLMSQGINPEEVAGYTYLHRGKGYKPGDENRYFDTAVLEDGKHIPIAPVTRWF